MLDPGVLPVDKPAGPSSFRMVQLVRRATGIKKVGHAGTLDPFASGLLLVCIGRPATRLVDRLMVGDKEYEATVQLGVTTATHDPEGEILDRRPVTAAHFDALEAALDNFRGELWQSPPAFSAAKHQGKPLYSYARRGEMISKPPRRVLIHRLEVVSRDHRQHRVVLRVCCSKGTYIRSLAHDLGQALGCGAHLAALRRLASGDFRVEQALAGERLLEPQAAAAVAAGALPVPEVEGRLLKP
ncbi:tRNA pseudouridine(55) synthase TruB [Desulfurivibrio alkaliphilus]|uniref:tRNA pseudouridine synthase B n=1 Tax=Desulfurivibrio alkaliphilus (strain DSM 19089 / UNIQEM U267 / AHT2) TaxID=589865 RepID=D6Z4T2_DESAT|nr:tRNA pseudouridine(55) synthase TruB [Desulfurivibrio alkaliphilus]ADH86557.1 tRNA pseudouridine synthase B [Desulfurivibrio alkaliphilus AHT 2]